MNRTAEGARPRGFAASDGFTLVELLVVLVIVMVLAGLLVTGAMAFRARMRREAAKVDMQTLTIALSGFFKDHHSYPPDKFDIEDIDKDLKPKDMFFFPSKVQDPAAFFHEGILMDEDEGRASNELMVYYLSRELQYKLNSFGPYMEFKRRQLKHTEAVVKDEYLEFVDPWGRPYVYIENHSDNLGKSPEERQGHGPFEIYSCGPDGKLDHDYWQEIVRKLDRKDDDIASWSE